MTLDDETAERIANETWAKRGKRHTVSGEEYVRAGYAARDAEVEELRAEVQRAEDQANNLAGDLAQTERERDAALATLAKVREHHRREEFEDSPGVFFCARCQRTAGLWPCETVAILDESPTERETPADARRVADDIQTAVSGKCGVWLDDDAALVAAYAALGGGYR